MNYSTKVKCIVTNMYYVQFVDNAYDRSTYSTYVNFLLQKEGLLFFLFALRF